MYASKDPNAVIKISDFGLAKVHDSNLMTTQCGTPSYAGNATEIFSDLLAPEVLEGKPYDEKVDCWSIGIILYIL